MNNLNILEKMYNNLSYFDQYGGSVIILIFINIIVFIILGYCYAKIHAQPIVDNWVNERCKPYIIPIAGLLTHPAGMTASEYTAENFQFCTQNILTSITGYMLEPLTFTINSLGTMSADIEGSINDVRAMFDKIRTLFQTITQEIMGRIMNIMIPLQQIIISFRDMIAKVQGIMTAALMTLLGGYYALQSLMGAIAQFIIIILIAMAALIAVFWLFPFTWGFAISNTAIFIALSIPLAIMLAFMSDVLQVHANLSIPTLAQPSVKCFDKNTLIKLNDGMYKPISFLNFEDILKDNNKITSIIKVETNGSVMYSLNGVIVSDSHIVYYNGKWIRVSEHIDAVKINDYSEPFLYCLNTENKIIEINDTIFTDWDEVFEHKLNKLFFNVSSLERNCHNIHKYLDYGFAASTKIKMKNGKNKSICDVEIGDITENGEYVYGTVKINGSDIDLDKNMKIKYYSKNDCENLFCGSNFINMNKNDIRSNNYENEKIIHQLKKSREHFVLYHLLTDKKYFEINNKIVYDYNSLIDLHIN